MATKRVSATVNPEIGEITAELGVWCKACGSLISRLSNWHIHLRTRRHRVAEKAFVSGQATPVATVVADATEHNLRENDVVAKLEGDQVRCYGCRRDMAAARWERHIKTPTHLAKAGTLRTQLKTAGRTFRQYLSYLNPPDGTFSRRQLEGLSDTDLCHFDVDKVTQECATILEQWMTERQQKVVELETRAAELEQGNKELEQLASVQQLTPVQRQRLNELLAMES